VPNPEDPTPGEPPTADDARPALSQEEIDRLEGLLDNLRSAVVQDEEHVSPETRIRLGATLFKRYQALGDPNSLSEAVTEFERAVTVAGWPNNGFAKAYLATCLSRRYTDLADDSSLNASIRIFREACEQVPGSRDSWWVYANYADALWLRYGRYGRRNNLDEAIKTYRTALGDVEDAHAPQLHLHLSRCLIAMHDDFGDPSGLVSASKILQDGLSKLHGPSVSMRGVFLTVLGDVNLRRYESFGELGCLDHAISSYQLALNAKTSLDYARVLANLGNALRARHARSNLPTDLDQAINTLWVAVDSTPRMSAAAPDRVLSLCNSLIQRHQAAGEAADQDLSVAIITLKNAVVACPYDNPARSRMLYVLGQALLAEDEQHKTNSNRSEAVAFLRLAHSTSNSASRDRPKILVALAGALLDPSSPREVRWEATKHVAEAILMTSQADPEYPLAIQTFMRIASQNRYQEALQRIPQVSDSPRVLIVAVQPGASEPAHLFSDATLSLQEYLRSLDLDGVEPVLDREPPGNSDATESPEAGQLRVFMEPAREKVLALLVVITLWSNVNGRPIRILSAASGREIMANLNILLRVADPPDVPPRNTREEG
jgi:tetratricopeptide (TPR) repeat protein